MDLDNYPPCSVETSRHDPCVGGYLDIMQIEEIRKLFWLNFSEMRFIEVRTAINIVFVMVRIF